MRLVKVLITNAQADLNLLWAHISEGTFSEIDARKILLTCSLKRKYVSEVYADSEISI